MSGTRAILTRRELSSSPPLQGKAPTEIHAILTETLFLSWSGQGPLYDDVADLNEAHQRWKSQNTNLKGIIGYYSYTQRFNITFNPLNIELKPICHLVALLGAHHILLISKVRVNYLLLARNVM